MLKNLWRRFVTSSPQQPVLVPVPTEQLVGMPAQKRVKNVAANHSKKNFVTIETRNQRREQPVPKSSKPHFKKHSDAPKPTTQPTSNAPAKPIIATTGANSAITTKTVRPKRKRPAKTKLKNKNTQAQLPKNPQNRLAAFLSAHKTEAMLIAILVAISIVAHAWNMFGYPYLENDEATYTSRAWSFITTGELDVYTYRYDHAPLGWIVLGFWFIITGGAHLFGSLLESGRVFMLALHIASTIVLYVIARRFSGGSRVAPAVAVLVFALSPLAIYFQRRILLDNIMTFWLLISILIVTNPKRRLKHYMGSGLAFGVAVLTKLNAIFLGPAFLYIIWRRAKREHRIHALGYWLAAAGMVVASFFLFALLKGELFAAPLDANGDPAHVSVMDTFALQLGRGEFAWFWDPQSSFRQNVDSWLTKDTVTPIVGAIAAIMLGIIGFFRRKKDPYMFFVFLLCLCTFAFLARGKIVLDLYIVPVIPLLALAIGLVCGWFVSLGKSPIFKAIFVSGLLLIMGLTYGGMVANKQYTVQEVSNQTKAVDWVLQHVPKDAVIATDNYAYPALAQEHGYTNVSYFFSTEYDPEIRKVYHDDWRNVEYLIVTHEVIEQIKTGTVPHMKEIFDHADLVADYRSGASSFIDLKNYISTNGDWAQVYKTKSRNDIVQQDSWDYFKSHFIIDYGQVVDRTNGDATTSANQATAMLRALKASDKDTFGGVWQWSKDHLRYRQTDVLLSWQWQKQPDGKYALGDSNTVCDADQQLAYALLQAGETWKNKTYLEEGKAHLADWWAQCVFERNGKLYVDSSADGSQDIRLINPGYFTPAYYDYFARIMPSLPWQRLTDDGYVLLDAIYERWQTIPNWIVMDTDGSLSSAEPIVGAGGDSFGLDALQLVPHLVAKAQDPRASSLLHQLVAPVTTFVAANPGPGNQAAELLLQQATLTHNKSTRQATYQTVILKPYNAQKGTWHDGKNYRDQVWFWQWHQAQGSLPSASRVILK